MVRRCRAAVFLLCVFTAVPAGAQFCTTPAYPGYFPGGVGFLGIAPSAPTASQTITLTVGAAGYEPQSVSAQVAERTITVVLRGAIHTLSPPGLCGSTMVGPLAPGSYVVQAYAQNSITGAVSTIGNAPLIVVSSSVAVESIPAVAPGALVGLACLLAGVAVRSLRRSRREP